MVRLLLAVLIGFAMPPPAGAQPSETFEVATVKLGDPLEPGTSFQFDPGAGIRIKGSTLKNLVEFAYNLQDFQLTGASGWMTSERYTIQAKGALPEGPADYRSMNDQQRKAAGELIRIRLQRLLEERFQLAVHRETKQLPIYALVVAKNGPKLQPNLSPDGSPQSMTQGRAMFRAQRASPADIARGLSGITRRPVRDETGLTGYYDFKMEWTPDAAPAAPGSEAKAPETVGPTLFTALQEQLGLKLEAKKGPVEVLVVDRAERPSEN